jgi:hypothetical protein
MAWTVCVTMTSSVAAGSPDAGRSGRNNGMARMVTGKQAVIARAILPKNIRIELVVIFIVHLQIVPGDGRAHLENGSQLKRDGTELPVEKMVGLQEGSLHMKNSGLKHK